MNYYLFSYKLLNELTINDKFVQNDFCMLGDKKKRP